ncbi:hypothetical protein NKG05_14845 [Oerskovia sp. M15]
MLALDTLAVVAESSSAEEGGVKLVVVGVLLLAGPLFYWLTWRRYRNAGERHDHRRETRSDVRDVRAPTSTCDGSSVGRTARCRARTTGRRPTARGHQEAASRGREDPTPTS